MLASGGCGAAALEGSGKLIEGGTMTLGVSSQPDFLDPALSYTASGWEAMWIVYTPLLTYAHVEGPAKLIPGLADALPRISTDGRTYALRLRRGLTYSDGQPVRASDFEHSVARVLYLGSGGAPFFEPIEGAIAYEKAGRADDDISGIETDDQKRTITIHLTGPDASFSDVLAMNFGGLVPRSTPFENLTKDPPPGVGPYVITESIPNRDFVLERRRDFPGLGIDGVPAGHVDTLRTLIIKSQAQQTQDVLNNELDYMHDPPDTDLKPTVLAQVGPEGSEPQRYESQPATSTYFFFLNTAVAPFDDPLVRQAVNVGVDRAALARLFASELTPGCSFLPPGFPGYDKGFDTTECPFGDPREAPDIERAQALLSEAGAVGAAVTVWGYSGSPTSRVTEAYADQLSEIGFDVDLKILDTGVYYQAIADQSEYPQTGFTNWFADFPHPLNFYFLVDGDSIQPQNNQNTGNVNDPRINSEIASLRLQPDVAAVANRWAALDRYLVGECSYIVPYGHRTLATFVSERVDFDSIVFHPLFLNDYTSFQLKDLGW